jgi:hypothetical protein
MGAVPGCVLPDCRDRINPLTPLFPSLSVICSELALFTTLAVLGLRASSKGQPTCPSSHIYNPPRAIGYRLPVRPPLLLGSGPHQSPPPPYTMVTPSFAQNSASRVSLPPGDFRPSLKSKVSISSVANAVFRRKLRSQDHPAHPKIFTKGNGPCMLTLNADHESSSGLPIFPNGAVISGSLEISKVSKILHSIQIMVTIPVGTPASVEAKTNRFHRSQGGSSFKTLEAP